MVRYRFSEALEFEGRRKWRSAGDMVPAVHCEENIYRISVLLGMTQSTMVISQEWRQQLYFSGRKCKTEEEEKDRDRDTERENPHCMTAVNMVGKNPNSELTERERAGGRGRERGNGMEGGCLGGGGQGVVRGVGEGVGWGVGVGREKTGQDKIIVL